MLAQNFKSAADLEITDKQLEALMKTLVLMETGKLTYFLPKEIGLYDDGNVSPLTFHFNMDSWAVKHECGTVRCIGGTAEAIGNVQFEGKPLSDALNDLFYPYDISHWQNITVEQGARALRNYLTYGEARWQEVMENNNG